MKHLHGYHNHIQNHFIYLIRNQYQQIMFFLNI